MKSLTAIDAFCGAGGLSIGLADVGFDILLGFDVDKKCIETLIKNSNTIQHTVLQSDVEKPAVEGNKTRNSAGKKMVRIKLV